MYTEEVGSSGIQGDSGGKVNILEGNGIGHCEKRKVYMNMYRNSEWLPR